MVRALTPNSLLLRRAGPAFRPLLLLLLLTPWDLSLFAAAVGELRGRCCKWCRCEWCGCCVCGVFIVLIALLFRYLSMYVFIYICIVSFYLFIDLGIYLFTYDIYIAILYLLSSFSSSSFSVLKYPRVQCLVCISHVLVSPLIS